MITRIKNNWNFLGWLGLCCFAVVIAVWGVCAVGVVMLPTCGILLSGIALTLIIIKPWRK